ncbi:unnamed protein product [Brassicogethes aeneus]|uniref:Aminopeptidase n=1 Tax=Brassicogethes aeneus TaxID=1431903 RepID=A0A9P0AZT7_BRAAE|nr:unnamed protein product [Brassicogethes aeneus]
MQPRPSTQQFQIQSTLAKIMLLGGLNLCLICALIWATDAQKEYRLPQNIYPESYFINLTIDADAFTANNDDFKGEVGIVIVVKEATNNISIHKSDTLSITKILFDSAEIKITETTFYNETTQILNITIPDNLNVNDRHILNITYDGKFTSDMLGFYKSSYEDRGKTKYLLTTQFQATFARRAFPCFDEPEFKSVFNLTVTHPNTTTVLSNTDVNKTIANGFKNTTTFNSTPKMSSYLVAFIISEFSCNKYAGLLYTMVPQRVCSRDGVNHTTREWALNEGVSILNMLNQYTKIYYTDYNNKMDQVAIPDFTAGAMENWGLVTYRERSLLWSDTDSSNRYKQTISAIVAHEFAHMWFGNLVTSRWWNTIFLNEGFARYFQYILTGILHNDWQMENQFVVEQLQLAMAADDIPTAQALQQDAYTPPAISARFGTISYSKGASVFRMVSHFLGGEMFKKGLQFYLNERKLNYTEPDMLWNSFNITNANLPDTMTNLMKNWVEKNGFPLINVNRSENTLTLTQEKFLRQGKNVESKWYVPISYTLANDTFKFESTLPRAWLTPNLDVVEIDVGNVDWVILNNKATGYYRVNYDPALWDQITLALNAKNFSGIPENNRAQIVDDVFNLAKIGKLSYSIAFKYLSFLEKDTSYFPWYSAFSGFTYLEKRISKESKLGQAISKHISTWMSEIYGTIGIPNSNNQIYTHKLVLTNSWACKLGNEECLDDILSQFKGFKNFNARLDPNLQGIVFCNALRYTNDTEDWHFLWNLYKTTDVSTEKVTLLGALGCTENKNLLKTYLEHSINENSGIKPQDALSVFSAVQTSQIGVNIALQFLKNNYASIQSSYKSLNALSNLIEQLADKFTTKEQLEELQNFIDELKKKPGDFTDFISTAEISLKAAEANIQWVENLGEYLFNYYNINDNDDNNNNNNPGSSSTIHMSFVVIVPGLVFLLFK